MIKKYRADHYSGRITTLDVLRETEWSVFVPSGSGTEQVIAKRTEYRSYHDSFEAAREALRARFIADLGDAERRLKNIRDKLMALDDQEEES